MNGFERIKSAIDGKMPDKRPIMLHNFMLAVAEYGCSMKQYREDPQIAADCHIRFTEKYGIDGVLFDVDTALLASAAGAPVDYPENDPARVYGSFISSLDDVDTLEDVDISENVRIQHSLEVMKILRKHFGHEIFLRGNCDQAPFSLACALRGPEAFMMDLVLEPEKAKKLIDYTSRISVQMIHLMAQAGVDMVSNGDSPAGPEMISPDMYREFALEPEKLLLNAAHEEGVPYLMHICGNTEIILQDMAEAGFDAVELDYKTPTEAIFKHFSKSTTIFGTVDPSGVIALGKPEDVRREILELEKYYEGNPRIVYGAGCAIPPMTPEENIRMFVETVRGL